MEILPQNGVHMEINVKEKIAEIAEKIMKDEKLQKQFKDEPVKAIEKLLDVDLPDAVVEKIIDGVKAKIAVDKVADVAGMFKKMF